MEETSILLTQRVAIAAGLAVAASISLLIGAALGLYARASQRVIAAVMAFGSGALIQALAVELALDGADRLVREHALGRAESWLWVAGGFVIGGLIYYAANRWIEKGGGHLRKPALMKPHVFRMFAHLPHVFQHDVAAPTMARPATVAPTGQQPTRAMSVYEHGAEAKLMEAHKENGGSDVPVAIFLGALLDGIPESVVIGAGFTTLATFNPTFLVAVFLSNLPEALSSAAGMKRAGFSTLRIFGLWGGLVVVSGLAAAVGNAFLVGASPTLIVLVEATAGGSILAMLASTMMPEAFEDGGLSVGISTIAGFLAAFYFTTLGM